MFLSILIKCQNQNKHCTCLHVICIHKYFYDAQIVFKYILNLKNCSRKAHSPQVLTNSLFPLFPKNTPKPLTADMHPAVLQSRGQTGMYTQTQAKGIAGHQKIHTHTHACTRTHATALPSVSLQASFVSSLLYQVFRGKGNP